MRRYSSPPVDFPKVRSIGASDGFHFRLTAKPMPRTSHSGLLSRGTESSQTLRWRETDSNFRYRGAKAADFRSIPGIAGVSAGLLNDTA